MNREKIIFVTKKYVFPGAVLLAVAFSVVCNLFLLGKVDELSWRIGMQEIGNVGGKSIDSQLSDLRREMLTVRFITYDIINSGMVDAANQYNISEYTTCKDINMRLGIYFSAYNLMYSTDTDNELFKAHVDDLIEVNEDRTASVRTWEHIEYCLLNQ